VGFFRKVWDKMRAAFGADKDKLKWSEPTKVEVIPPRAVLPIRRLLRHSAFTKKGPGVRRNIRNALLWMTREQRLICRKKGWDRGMVTPEGGVR